MITFYKKHKIKFKLKVKRFMGPPFSGLCHSNSIPFRQWVRKSQMLISSRWAAGAVVGGVLKC
jgi:hypothetical protein